MPDPSTTRISLYKSKSDGSELVTYTQDIAQNWDKVDLAVGFQAATSSTRPSTPYSGKPIFQTDTAYSTYFNNGTSPASAGWVEIPNSSAAYAGRLITNFPGSTGTTSLVRLAQTGTATANRALASRGSGDTVDRFFFDFDGKIQWGAGGSSAADTNLYRSAANVLSTDDTFVIAGDLKLAAGATVIRNQVAASVTVANTTTETIVGTITIPAGDAAVGAIYRVTVFGTASVTGTPTFTVRGRLGGVAGTLAATLGPTTAGSGVTGQSWSVDFDLVCLTTGASATWMPRFVLAQNVSTASAQTGSVLLPVTAASITQDSTVSNTMVVTWAWSAASASNTATARAICYRIA